jgi:putative PEP-CTERM system TPR-repeat lipoprotein
MSRAWRPAVAAACALALAWQAAAAADPNALRFYEDALVRFERKDYAGAIVQLKNSLQQEKDQIAVQLLLGKALLANSEVAAAEVALSEALRLGVNRAEAVVPLAQSLITQGKHQKLVNDSRFVTDGLPSAVQARLMLVKAAALADMGQPRDALRLIADARGLDPRSAETWLAEVTVRIRAGQMAEAAAAADKALALAPVSGEAHYQKGSVAHARNQGAPALASYSRALELMPEHMEARLARAGLLLDLGRVDEARADLAEVQKQRPKEPRASYLRALAAERSGDGVAARTALAEVVSVLDLAPMEYLYYRPQLLILGGLSHFGLGAREKAKPYLETLQKQSGANPANRVLAQIYLDEGLADRAIETLDPLVRANPGDAQAIKLLSAAHTAKGRHARSAQLLQRALDDKDSPTLRSALGMSLLGAGQSTEAIAPLEASFRKDPTQLEAGAALVGLYLHAGQAAKAKAVAESLVARSPKTAGFHNLLGLARTRTQDNPGARQAFERAAQLDPRFMPAQINLARLDVMAGNLASAGGRLNKALEINPRHVDLLIELGLLAERQGQAAQATRWLEKANDQSGTQDVQPGLLLLEHHLQARRPGPALEVARQLSLKAPDNAEVLLAGARANLALGDRTSAKAQLDRAGRLAGFQAPKLTEVALLQFSAGDLEGAAYNADKALQAQGDFAPALSLMADIELKQGNLASAEKRALKLVSLQPKLAVGHSLVGNVAVRRGQMPAAIEAYRRAHRIEPGTDTLLQLFSAQATRDFKGAANLAEQWLQANPKDIAVRRTLADSYARMGNWTAARGAYEAALKQSPNDAGVLNNLAHTLLRLNDRAGAAQAAERALAAAPSVPYVIGTAGWTAFNNGQTDRALQLLRDARLRDPSNPDTRYYLAATLAKAGRPAEARSELEAALQGGAQFASAGDARALLGTLK